MNKTYELKIRCAGTKAQYWTLNLKLNNQVVQTHTSKSYNYITEILNNWTQKPHSFSSEWR